MNNIICLWSCPRNVSTALMYSFAQREDTCVFDEPLYAHYLKASGAIHPGREEILNTLENNGDKVIDTVILQETNKLIFHKLMTHFLIEINTDFLSLVRNIIFIRSPEEIISSYSKVLPHPTIKDIGVKKQYELYLDLEIRGNPAIVLDSKYLLKNPELILQKLCVLLDVPFDKNMLSWKMGGISEDGVWAKYWYKNVHNSTGFFRYNKKKITLSEDNLLLAKESYPYYKFLTKRSIRL